MGFIIRHSCSCFLNGCASLTSIDCRQMSEQVFLTMLEVAGWIFRQGVWWSRFSHCSWKGNILLSSLAQSLHIQWVNLITEHSYVLRSLHRHHYSDIHESLASQRQSSGIFRRSRRHSDHCFYSLQHYWEGPYQLKFSTLTWDIWVLRAISRSNQGLSDVFKAQEGAKAEKSAVQDW
jgi:hypothetical protein